MQDSKAPAIGSRLITSSTQRIGGQTGKQRASHIIHEACAHIPLGARWWGRFWGATLTRRPLVGMERAPTHVTRPGVYIIIHRVSIPSELIHGVDIIRKVRANGYDHDSSRIIRPAIPVAEIPRAKQRLENVAEGVAVLPAHVGRPCHIEG